MEDEAPTDAAADHGARIGAWVDSHFRRIVSSQTYRAEVDGARFVAIAVVVIGHMLQRLALLNVSLPQALIGGIAMASAVTEPFIGVLIFFGVSGFIITSQFVQGDAVCWDPRRYFFRRITRIEPPYLIILVMTFIVISTSLYKPVNPNFYSKPPSSLLESLTFSVLYIHDLVFGANPRLFVPGWTLEVEVQFYLLAPFVCVAFLKLRRLYRTITALAVLLAGIVLADAVDISRNIHLVGSILRMFPYFWTGVIVADLNRQGAIGRIRLPGAAIVSLWCLSLAVILASALIPVGAFYRVLFLLSLQCACIGGLLLTTLVDGPIKTLMSRPALSLIGGACYSIYLVHLQAIQFTVALCAHLLRDVYGPLVLAIEVAACLSVVFAVGMVFYAAVERPCMIPDWPQKLVARLLGKRSRTGVVTP